jgi:hypothetical protein
MLRIKMTLLLVWGSFYANAQEVITPLQRNAVQYEHAKKQARVSNTLDTLALPFIDDFSNTPISPARSRWTDRFVYINTDMAVDPPTLGVATFDGLDERGIAYDIFAPTVSGLADRLSSQAMNLQNDGPADSVYLSFFYQPAGRCDPPEPNDSLTLEFFGRDGSWHSVWRVTGTNLRPFEQIFIHVGDSLFLHRGFRFRFSSYGNLTGNVDVWHLDYVRLNRNRNLNDTLIIDVGYVMPPSSMLNLYQDMPLRQFKADTTRWKSATHEVTARNLGDPRNVGYKFTSINKATNAVIADPVFQFISPFNGAGTQNTFSFLPIDIPVNGIDSLTLQTTYVLQNAPDFRAANDTVRRTHRFWNHYAYDDGTAETGYGLNIIGGSVAYKFYVSERDTLQGVWMYFTQAAENAALEVFNLKVWSFIGEGGFSGNEVVIRQQDLLRPRYADSIGQFVYYALDTPVIVQDSFYVGWQQLTPRLLNIGLDRNHQVAGVKWFNVQGQWNPSLITGMWMIRPVVGDSLRFPTSVRSQPGVHPMAKIYPNPASDRLFIEHAHAIQNCRIFDMSGRLQVLFGAYQHESGLDLSQLPAGMYILELTDDRQGQSRQKLMISR